jgi:hypothetical protein
MNAHVNPAATKTDTEYLLAALRCASRRLKLIDEEIILIGLALQKRLITPQEAIARTEEIAPGCLDVVATSMGVLA